jgi:hypothetical protein
MNAPTPIRYAVAPRGAWRDGSVSDAPGAVTVGAFDLRAAVEDMTGRAHVLAVPSCARKLRTVGGRLYVAPSRGMVGAIIERTA